MEDFQEKVQKSLGRFSSTNAMELKGWVREQQLLLCVSGGLTGQIIQRQQRIEAFGQHPQSPGAEIITDGKHQNSHWQR